MKIYSFTPRGRRLIHPQAHFATGRSVRTACGLTLWSRLDDLIITDQPSLVTCKRCLAAKARWQRMLDLQAEYPGIFDRDSLCGTEWLLDHARDVSPAVIDAQSIEIKSGNRQVTLRNDMKRKDIRELLHGMTAKEAGI